MLLKSRQQAWIRGLPGLDQEGGTSCNTLPVRLPTPEKRSLTVTLYGSSELIASLLFLSRKRIKIPQLTITNRTDPAKGLDDEIQLADVVVDSVTLLADKTALEVNLLFNSVSARLGLAQNPGPPVNCPSIQLAGVNTGWIFGLADEDLETGMPVAIVDFTPPHYNKQFTITTGKLSGEMISLIQHPLPIRELILVLPDRSRQRYVEFKLWDAKATLLEDPQRIVLESEMIACLTGQVSWLDQKP